MTTLITRIITFLAFLPSCLSTNSLLFLLKTCLCFTLPIYHFLVLNTKKKVLSSLLVDICTRAWGWEFNFQISLSEEEISSSDISWTLCFVSAVSATKQTSLVV